jgi:hypothetical protein
MIDLLVLCYLEGQISKRLDFTDLINRASQRRRIRSGQAETLLMIHRYRRVGVVDMAPNGFFAETALPVGLGVLFTVAILLLSVLF